ncbi:MAG: ATP synthase F1 subunit delta [Candidatus Gastranaerophilaceae bacterium]
MSVDKNLLIAERYAQSLIDFGNEGKLSFMTITTDLVNIQTILSKSSDLFDVLTNPLVSVENKLDVISAVFSNEIDTLLVNFLKILVERDRFAIISDIIAVYNTLLDKVNDVARIEVISAVELNENEKTRIYDKLVEKIHKQISVKYNIDKSVIAGLVFKMGDDLFDMSVSRKLENLKKAVIK